MKTPKGLQPLIDDGIIDAVLRPLKSGKEASVYVVRAGDEIRCAKGLLTRAGAAYAEVGPLDYLLIPGGFASFEELKNPVSVEFIREQAKGAKAVLSVCTGTFLLHRCVCIV